MFFLKMAKTCLTWLSTYKMYGGTSKSDEFRPKNPSHAGPTAAADGWFLRRTPMYGHSWLFPQWGATTGAVRSISLLVGLPELQAVG